MDQGEAQVSLMDTGAEAPAEVGTRPEGVLEQHWNSETGEVRVDALTKSYVDARTALSAKQEESGIPESSNAYVQWAEDGNVVLPEGLDNLPPIAQGDPLLSGVLEAAHAKGVSQDQMDGILGAFFSGQNEIYTPYAFDADQVYADISDNRQQAEGVVSAVNVYLAGMGLDEDGQQAASDIMATAGGIKLLHAITSSTGVKPVPVAAPQVSTVDVEAQKARWDELRTMDIRIGTPEYEEFEKIGNTLFKGKSQH